MERSAKPSKPSTPKPGLKAYPVNWEHTSTVVASENGLGMFRGLREHSLIRVYWNVWECISKG